MLSVHLTCWTAAVMVSSLHVESGPNWKALDMPRRYIVEVRTRLLPWSVPCRQLPKRPM